MIPRGSTMCGRCLSLVLPLEFGPSNSVRDQYLSLAQVTLVTSAEIPHCSCSVVPTALLCLQTSLFWIRKLGLGARSTLTPARPPLCLRLGSFTTLFICPVICFSFLAASISNKFHLEIFSYFTSVIQHGWLLLLLLLKGLFKLLPVDPPQ